MMLQHPAKFGWLQHLRLIAVAQHPPDNFLQSIHSCHKVHGAICIPTQALCGMPGDLGNICRHQRLKSNDDIASLTAIGDEVPGVPEVAFQAEPRRNFIGVVRQLGFDDAAKMECSNGPMQGRCRDERPMMYQQRRMNTSRYGLTSV